MRKDKIRDSLHVFYFARHLTPTFRKALLDVCFHVSKDNRIVHEVRKIYNQN